MASDVCTKMGFVLRIMAQLFFYIRIIIPIILIVMIIIDLAKVVVGQADDKAKKEMTNRVVKRMIYAVIVFLVPTLINFIFVVIDRNITIDGTATNWVSCWTQYYK